MPNHIQSQVEITGDKDKIAKLIKDLKLVQDPNAEKNEFDFNAIIPTPEDIFQGNLGQAERDKYGNRNWYDWNSANWGTKWNAYDVKYIAGNDTGFVVEIQTAWDSPRPIWEALREQGFTVKGVMFGEMDGFEMIGGEENNPFEAYLDVQVDYCGEIENV